MKEAFLLFLLVIIFAINAMNARSSDEKTEIYKFCMGISAGICIGVLYMAMLSSDSLNDKLQMYICDIKAWETTGKGMDGIMLSVEQEQACKRLLPEVKNGMKAFDYFSYTGNAALSKYIKPTEILFPVNAFMDNHAFIKNTGTIYAQSDEIKTAQLPSTKEWCITYGSMAFVTNGKMFEKEDGHIYRIQYPILCDGKYEFYGMEKQWSVYPVCIISEETELSSLLKPVGDLPSNAYTLSAVF